jgi:signal transduction histidine kinase/tetratricopeptide (TPR) repeat protein
MKEKLTSDRLTGLPQMTMFACALLVVMATAFAQPNPAKQKIDSLLRVAGNAHLADTLRANAYLHASDLLLKERDPNGHGVLRQSLNFSDSLGYTKGKGFAHYNFGYYYRFINLNYAKAEENFIKAYAIFKELGLLNEYGTTCIHLGIIHQGQRRIHNALEYYLEASKVLEGETNQKNAGLGYELIADVYGLKGDYDNALLYYQKAIKRFEQNKRYPLLREAYLNLANFHITNKQAEEAENILSYYNGIRDEKATPNHRLQVAYLHSRGRLFHLLNQCDKALLKFDSAWHLAGQYKIPLGLDFFVDKASCYFHLHRYAKAGQVLVEARALPAVYRMPELQRDALSLQAMIYEATGKPILALREYKKYVSISDSLQKVFNTLNLKDLEYKLETERKEKENAMLKLDLEIQHQKIKTQNLLLVSGVVIIVLGLLCMVVLLTSRAQIRKKNVLLSDQNKEIQAQNEEIIAQHEEISAQAEELRYKNEFLELQNERLEETNHEKDGLMSIVAHDLRAPLNRTKGLASLLRTRQFAAEDIEIVDKILRVSDDGIRLIKDILDVNAIQHDSNILKYNAVNLKAFLLDEIIKPLHESASKKSIQLITAIDDRIELLIDTLSLKRIFDNLISNAIKFSPPQTRVIVRATLSHDCVFVGVQDQGPGISAEDQRKMFRKFQRLSARPTGGEHSTGLGLSIVKSLVEKLKGEITVESDLDAGTEFIVKLPRQNMVPLSKMVS